MIDLCKRNNYRGYLWRLLEEYGRVGIDVLLRTRNHLLPSEDREELLVVDVLRDAWLSWPGPCVGVLLLLLLALIASSVVLLIVPVSLFAKL